MGLVGCLVLITLFGLFMWRGLIIAERADSPLGTYLGIGIVWMVVVQAVINMSVGGAIPADHRYPAAVYLGGRVVPHGYVGSLRDLAQH